MTLQYTIFVYRNEPNGISCKWAEAGAVNRKAKEDALNRLREIFAENPADFKKIRIYQDGEKIIDRTNFIRVGGRLQGDKKGVENF